MNLSKWKSFVPCGVPSTQEGAVSKRLTSCLSVEELSPWAHHFLPLPWTFLPCPFLALPVSFLSPDKSLPLPLPLSLPHPLLLPLSLSLPLSIFSLCLHLYIPLSLYVVSLPLPLSLSLCLCVSLSPTPPHQPLSLLPPSLPPSPYPSVSLYLSVLIWVFVSSPSFYGSPPTGAAQTHPTGLAWAVRRAGRETTATAGLEACPPTPVSSHQASTLADAAAPPTPGPSLLVDYSSVERLHGDPTSRLRKPGAGKGPAAPAAVQAERQTAGPCPQSSTASSRLGCREGHRPGPVRWGQQARSPQLCPLPGCPTQAAADNPTAKTDPWICTRGRGAHFSRSFPKNQGGRGNT